MACFRRPSESTLEASAHCCKSRDRNIIVDSSFAAADDGFGHSSSSVPTCKEGKDDSWRFDQAEFAA